jgi:dTDP-4-amino-4,6-dideoxygalactose transaminase
MNSYVGHLFPLFTFDFNGLKNHLNLNGIDYGVHYPINDQLQNAWNPSGKINLDTKQKTAITIPISQYLESNQIKKIIDVINAF